MKLKQFAIVSLFIGCGAIGCGGLENDSVTDQLALEDDDDDSDCDSDSELDEIFEDATSRYRNPDNLAPDGWVQLQEACFEEDEGTVQLGIVFVRPAIIDGVIDPDHPEVLYYEPQADGSLRLMGGEYFCPIEACPTPPSYCGHTFRFEEDTNGHALHVWAWKTNPNGLTDPANPRVNTAYCP